MRAVETSADLPPTKGPGAATHRIVWTDCIAFALMIGGCASAASTATNDAGNGGAQASSGSLQDSAFRDGSSAIGTSDSSVTASGSASGSTSGIANPPNTTGAPQDAQTQMDASAMAAMDTDSASTDAGGSNKILIYGVTTPGTYRHASIPTAAHALAQAAAAVGLTSEIVGASDATNVADPTKFTAAALAQDGAVVLISNDGEPFGYPATQEIQNLVDYVQNGGALLIVHCTPDSYGGAVSGPMLGHPASIPFHMLIGSTFLGHPGNDAPATCTTIGTHPSVAHLAPTFNVTDEIYSYSYLGSDIQVVMTCVSSADPNTVRASSFYRQQGAGRVFNVALGHTDANWTTPLDPKQPNTRLLEDHIVPGLLWAMRR
jgi:type 1 glutamine amidotransferase